MFGHSGDALRLDPLQLGFDVRFHHCSFGCAEVRVEPDESASVVRDLFTQLIAAAPYQFSFLLHVEVAMDDGGDHIQLHTEIAELEDPVQHRDLIQLVRAVPGGGIHVRWFQKADLVVVAEQSDGHPTDGCELSDFVHRPPSIRPHVA